ncbi:spore germination protein GerM [Desulfosalsimonas propionicica]|uniref:Spore germination protein GerM n=1 Tax=Desulfosalsimonas propionicica TaxID=332175 RepID=A0A7W0HJ80_9BACT|nr:GerMN domain-containing protein [Desulfosalsimonas propionicica]MBA2879831.1 spore germination protein GerM [Desulfosalsimonas propionicica]
MGLNRWCRQLPCLCLVFWFVFAGAAAGARNTASERHPEGEIFLYFVDPEAGYLAGEPRNIDFSNERKDPGQFYTRIVEELISGPKTRLEAPLSAQTDVRGVYAGTAGVAYVDLSAEAADLHTKGVRSELLSVYSIVNTLILNSNGIQAVQILIEGSPVQTLAGHVDIRLPLNAQMLLVR